ncbi:MAG TPA: arginine deiminase-related protein, partial [Phycicoccus elongatus]|nr:arginine deiminase-related protein [Phycicoccus elongatus]
TPVIAPADRPRVLDSLRATGHEVVELTMEQLEDFAGNALEVQGSQSRHLVMSARGVGSLTAAQRATIERRVPLHAVDIPTIEHAGGSARCMLAGIHLPRR